MESYTGQIFVAQAQGRHQDLLQHILVSRGCLGGGSCELGRPHFWGFGWIWDLLIFLWICCFFLQSRCANKINKSSFICCTKIERLSPKPDQSSETAIAVVTISVDLSSLPELIEGTFYTNLMVSAWFFQEKNKPVIIHDHANGLGPACWYVCMYVYMYIYICLIIYIYTFKWV